MEVEHLPEGAVSGPYALGKTIIVARKSIDVSARNPELPEWFLARVCRPANSADAFRWYDPFVHFETELDLTSTDQWSRPRNVSYVGKLFYVPTWVSDGVLGGPYYNERDFWAYPPDDFQRIFGEPEEVR